jgi:WD40 repeat protein
MKTSSKSGINGWSPAWIQVGTDYVAVLAWSPDATIVAAGYADGSLRLLESAAGTCLWQCEAHLSGIASLAWSPDGQFLLSGGQDGIIRRWQARNGQAAGQYDGLGHWVEHLAWSPDGCCWAASAGRVVQVWRADGERLWHGPQQASTVTGLAWLADSQHLLTAAYGGICLYRVGDHQTTLHYDRKGSFLSLAVSPDGCHVAGGCQDASMMVCNLETGERLTMSGYPGKITRLAWDDTSRYLASSGAHQVVVWDFSGKGPKDSSPLILDRHVDRISDLAFRPGLPQLASVGLDGLLILWQLPTIRIIRLHSAPHSLSCLAWHPQGQTLAVGTADGEVRLLPVPISP